MKLGRSIAMMAVVGLAVAACGGKPPAAPMAASAKNAAWLTDFDAAKKMAAQKKLPMLAYFSGSDWCEWCVTLDQEVFSQEAFMTYASSNLVLFIADFPERKEVPKSLQKQNAVLAEKYNSEGRFPTVLLLDATGGVLGKTGYQPGGPEKYVESLKAMLKK